MRWAIPTPEQYEERVFIQDGHGLVQTELVEAHKRLVESEGYFFQINIYLEHPLTVPYASPHTSAKFWLYEDFSEIIMSQRCSWSGDLEIDIQNFLSYRKVLMELSEIFQANAFAWGDTADNWPREAAMDSTLLLDQESMWSVFLEQLSPAVSEDLLQSCRQQFECEFLKSSG